MLSYDHSSPVRKPCWNLEMRSHIRPWAPHLHPCIPFIWLQARLLSSSNLLRRLHNPQSLRHCHLLGPLQMNQLTLCRSDLPRHSSSLRPSFFIWISQRLLFSIVRAYPPYNLPSKPWSSPLPRHHQERSCAFRHLHLFMCLFLEAKKPDGPLRSTGYALCYPTQIRLAFVRHLFCSTYCLVWLDNWRKVQLKG